MQRADALFVRGTNNRKNYIELIEPIRGAHFLHGASVVARAERETRAPREQGFAVTLHHAEELSIDAANGPHVDLGTIESVAKNHLRRSVPPRDHVFAHEARHGLSTRTRTRTVERRTRGTSPCVLVLTSHGSLDTLHKHARQAEIGKLDTHRLGINQNIRRLNIPVNNLGVVEVSNCTKQLIRNLANLFGSKQSSQDRTQFAQIRSTKFENDV
mmetsp:Transcript_2941/g.7178  ORF Transcript_2941/g.7178 Transcript_2941/m.7178 type:complete len:214 (-) Transcript_2941:368-1009(-)